MKATSFQSECRVEVEAALKTRKISSVEKDVEGQGEDYLVVLLDHPFEKLKIYIYYDEAGFFIGDQWTIFETPDYKSQGALKEAFLDSLADQLDDLRSVDRGCLPTD